MCVSRRAGKSAGSRAACTTLGSCQFTTGRSYSTVGGPGDVGREINRVCLRCRGVESWEGLGAFPRGPRAPKQALLLVGAQSCLCSPWREGGELGAEDAMGRTARCRQSRCDPLPGAEPWPLLSIGKREKKSELKHSFEINSPGKCVKEGIGTVLKSRVMFHLILIVRGESRKC